MSENKSSLEKIKESIEQMRDEIKLKAHLGQADAKDELEQLEKKWKGFLTEYKPLTDEAGKTAENAGAALALVGEEIKAGYKRLRKLL
jgi:archaellum component FlaC